MLPRRYGPSVTNTSIGLGALASTMARRAFMFLKSQVSPPEPAASKRTFRSLTVMGRTSEPEVDALKVFLNLCW